MELLTENESLKDSRLCLSYLGTFGDEITDKLIDISEFYLHHRTELGKIKNKVSFLIAECFQNIVRHGEAKEEKNSVTDNADFFQINVLQNKTILTSCNKIHYKYVADLEQKIMQVNSLDAEGLKQLRNDVLNNRGFSDKGGAGLGLIEMARKSGFPLKYLFKKIDNDYYLFFLSLETSSEKETVAKDLCINEIARFYDVLQRDKIIMLFKGDLSDDTILPLMEMAQNNFTNAAKVSGKKYRSIATLVEALQNVSKHGKIINGLREGIFMLSRSGDSYVINVGNPIDFNQRSALENSLEALKGMGREEIKDMSRKKLIDSQLVSHEACGLGLLKIAKNSQGNFQHRFAPYHSDSLFYTLEVGIQ